MRSEPRKKQILTRLVSALPVPIAALTAYGGSTALVGPGAARYVVMLVLFVVVGLAVGFGVDAVRDKSGQ